MPKARSAKVISDDGQFQTVQREVGERGKTKLAEFTRPTLAFFREFILNLSDTPEKDGAESPLATAWRHYVASLERKACADVYESLAAESTVITTGKEKVDIMEFPLRRLLKGINGARAVRDSRLEALGVEDATDPVYADQVKAVDRAIGYGPWRVAARKLVEGGQAREDEATGMLVAV